MAEATLVDADIEAGRDLVRLLDEDADEWRLVIRTPEGNAVVYRLAA